MDRTARALVDAAKGILSELDLDAVLERVVRGARELTGAHFAALGVLDESKEQLARFVTSGLDEQTRRRIGDPPRGRGVLGELVSNPVPLQLADIGAHPRAYGFPPGHPPMRSFLGVPVFVRGEPWGNLYLTDKQGGAEFTQDDEDGVVAFAELAGIAVENARRYTGAEGRRWELERTVAALRASAEISRALAGQTDLDAVLELVAKRARALVDARTVLIELPDGEDFVVAAAAGEAPRGLVGERLPAGEAVAAQVRRTGRTLALDEELEQLRFARHGWSRYGLSPRSGLFVPLSLRGEVLGVLAALDRTGEDQRFDDAERQLLEAFATSAATAVATARSVGADRARQRLAAAEEERRRWARELHDETLQGLAALRLGLTAARKASTADGSAEALDLAIDRVDDDIANLRALITDLRPAALDELGIESAIQALADRTQPPGIDVDLDIDVTDERFAPEVETALYRLTQEALTNAIKHAGATRVRIDMHDDDRVVRVAVSDNGRGFDPERPTPGFGLVGMRERVELLDGRLGIASTPGRGTTVSAALPARRRAGPPHPGRAKAAGR